jgi:hypothetical protein
MPWRGEDRAHLTRPRRSFRVWDGIQSRTSERRAMAWPAAVRSVAISPAMPGFNLLGAAWRFALSGRRTTVA